MKRFSTPLYWLLFFALFGAGVWVLLESRRRLAPPILNSGTEHMLSIWRSSILAYKKDIGEMPDVHLTPFATDEYRDSQIMGILEELNPLKKKFIVPRSVARKDMIPVDAWGRALKFDPENTGDLTNIISAGADGKFNTSDDISSLTTRSRRIPLPPE